MELEQKSPCNYGTAVILCGIFGLVGVHHFYLKNVVHGLIDLGLFLLAIILFASDLPLAGIVVLGVDALHSVIVFYLLIIEKQRDGDGFIVKLN